MPKFTIAFDCDGTLIKDGAMESHEIIANERVRSMLLAFANLKYIRVQGEERPRKVEIWVWSGGGELWARQVGRELGLDHYVDKYKSKNLLGRDENGHPIFDPDETPDWAVDDIQDCVLGRVNMIVREK